MLGDGLPVQEFVCGDGSLNRVDVEVAVHVTLPVNGISERKCFLMTFWRQGRIKKQIWSI